MKDNYAIGFKQSDGGRKAAGIRTKGDCVVRAFAELLHDGSGEGYLKVLDWLREFYDDPEFFVRDGVHKRLWHKMAKDLGVVKVKLGQGERPTYAEAHARYGDCIVTTTTHICAIVRGELRDIKDNRFWWWADDPDEQFSRKARAVWVKA